MPSNPLFIFFRPATAFLLLFILAPADRAAAQGGPEGLKPVLAALQRSGLKLSDQQPKAMDLDGDGLAEYIGRALTARRYGGRSLSAFFIVGTVGNQYKVLYKMVGNFGISGETLIDFNGDRIQDYYFRYGRNGRDFGTVLLWIQPGSVKPVYQQKSPFSFYLEDLDQDGLSEIIQTAGPFAGPGEEIPPPDSQWLDVYRWDAEKSTFLPDNARYPEFFKDRKTKFENLLDQINAQNVPGFDWSKNEKTFLDLKQRIETDYLLRIAPLTEPR